ncbi:MAG: hypothetical protein K0U98_21090 [Deltaproteobacteria bacterium]|nr:hypothetical protein [Deltaproteobacteria bacterium]
MTEERLRLVAEGAVSGYGDALRFLVGRQGDEPRPGDLFLLEATADAPLEWLILEGADPGNWKAIAADLNPSAGSADVALDSEGWAGPVTLRCGVSAVIPQSCLLPELRTGVVPTEVLERAQGRRREIESGELEGSVLEREIDQETEYRDWHSDVLQPALEAAKGSWTSLEAPRGVAAGAESLSRGNAASLPVAQSEFPSKSGKGKFHGWQMAAAVLATATVTLFLSQSELGTRATQGAQRQNPAPMVNPQLEWFQPATDALRGGGREILLSPQAQWLTIVLETWNPTLFSSYGVELERSSGAELVWTHDQLHRQGASEVIFTLPSSLLPPGMYVFRLSGQQDGESLPLEEFSFYVRREK